MSEDSKVLQPTVSPEEDPAPPPAEDGPTETPPGSEAAGDATPAEVGGEDHPDRPDGEGREPAAPRAPRKRPRDPALARAYRTGRPVEGKVEKTIKGGFEVRVGKSRAFCPFSQMDIHRIDDPEGHVGEGYFFKVIQFRRGGDDVVLSRRALLEEERSEEAKAVRATLIEGAITRGRVSSLAEFGVFVDLGAGVTGLVHISELAHTRVQTVEEVVQLGDWVPVKILKLDTDRGRISLSVRQAQDDPWVEAAESLAVGKVYPGTVARIADFGAFVEIAPGIEALASSRDFPPSDGGWRAELEPGTSAQWVVLEIEPERRRVAVAIVPDGVAVPTPLEEGAVIKGRVQRVEKFGVFVWLGPGAVGLVPNPWTGVTDAAERRRRFSGSREVEVEVVEVSGDRRRIRLGLPGVTREPLTSAETAAGRKGRRRTHEGGDDRSGSTNDTSPATFGTSLADALKAALRDRQDP